MGSQAVHRLADPPVAAGLGAGTGRGDPALSATTGAERRPRRPSLWPREHGAYVQLAYPVLCAWLLGSFHLSSVFLGLAAFAAFLSHEPVLLLLGRRGRRKREAASTAASRRLVLLGALTAGLGGAALALAPPVARWMVGIPVGIGILVVGLMAKGRERSLGGELVVAVALTSISLPVAAAAGVSIPDALTSFGAWTVCFALATPAARGVLFQKKDRGRCLRVGLWAAIVVAPLAAAVAVSGLTSPWIALSPLPFCAAAVVLALRPPSPRRMHALGFALMGACTVTLALLVVGIG